MSNIKAPKADRIGNDFHEGPNPGPGGEIDTGDSLVPPYDGRTRGRNETSEGPKLTMSEEAPSVGESTTHGDDNVDDRKEAGRSMPARLAPTSKERR